LGGGGDDDISGGFGRDRIDAGPGNDSVAGGPDDDVLMGGSGNDTLAGQLPPGPGPAVPPARDVCDGGIGTDTGLDCDVRTSLEG
jgi:Ca2+-binding RTX toxin-like protein